MLGLGLGDVLGLAVLGALEQLLLLLRQLAARGRLGDHCVHLARAVAKVVPPASPPAASSVGLEAARRRRRPPWLGRGAPRRSTQLGLLVLGRLGFGDGVRRGSRRHVVVRFVVAGGGFGVVAAAREHALQLRAALGVRGAARSSSRLFAASPTARPRRRALGGFRGWRGQRVGLGFVAWAWASAAWRSMIQCASMPLCSGPCSPFVRSRCLERAAGTSGRGRRGNNSALLTPGLTATATSLVGVFGFGLSSMALVAPPCPSPRSHLHAPPSITSSVRCFPSAARACATRPARRAPMPRAPGARRVPHERASASTYSSGPTHVTVTGESASQTAEASPSAAQPNADSPRSPTARRARGSSCTPPRLASAAPRPTRAARARARACPRARGSGGSPGATRRPARRRA